MSVQQEKGRRRAPLLGQDGNTLVSLVAINVILFAILKFLLLVYKVTDIDIETYRRSIFNWFILPADLSTLATRPWVLLTYMFTHDNLWQLIANMLWLWAFGFILQDMTGSKKLAPVYLYGGLAGAIFYILSYYSLPFLHHNISSAALWDANTAVMAVAIAATGLAPGYRIFPMINGGIPLWVFTLVYVIIDMAGIAPSDPAKYIAHLAGAAVGFFFVHQLRRGRDWSLWMNNFFDWFTNLFNPHKEDRNRKAKDEFFYKVKDSMPYTKTPNLTQERIDKVLDKINQQGYHKLTDAEKDILRRAANDGDL